MTATLKATAMTAIRMMSREIFFPESKAIRRAMKNGRFKKDVVRVKNYVLPALLRKPGLIGGFAFFKFGGGGVEIMEAVVFSTLST